MILDQNPHQAVTRFGCVGFLCPKCDNSACSHTCQDQNELHLKRWFFLPKSASSESRLQAHLAKRKRIGWLQLLNQLNFVWHHAKVFISNSSHWCVRNVQLLRTTVTALHTHFLQQQQYSRMYALFLAFRALVYQWWCQFLSLFSQNNEHTELTYAIFAHIRQHYHDVQSNAAIFLSVVQAYTQPYLFGGGIKLIICLFRHELSVIIHEITYLLNWP